MPWAREDATGPARRLALTLALISLAPAVAVAQMGGGGMGGGGGGMGGGGTSTALTSFTTADFSGSGVCAACHSRLTDGAGRDVSIDAHWRSTMMANSAKDPLWQAKISSEVARNPALRPVIEEKCSRCHMGMARYQAVTNGSPVAVLGSGFLDPAHALHAAAMDGVSCTLCHQIQASGLGTVDTFTGKYRIDTGTSSPNRVAYGPFPSPMQGPMRMQSGFTPVLGAQVTESELCASCHTLYTPSVRADGTVLDKEFPEQTTYLEWRSSTREQSCQDCHVPKADGAVVISNKPMMLGARSAFGDHVFAGANRQMLSLLKANASALGLTASPGHLDATVAATDEQLASRTAAVTIQPAPWDPASGRLTVAIDVQNQAGHKFPSGVPARRAWLHMTVRSDTGAVLFESGKPREDGSIERCAADADASVFEPHHDVISSPGEVQIYESVLLDSDGHVTQTLLRAATYAKDNRLLPRGFDKAGAASTDIAVVGDAQADDTFAAGQDRVTYQVTIPDGTPSVTVTAELLYQAVSHPFAVDLGASPTDLVERFLGMYAASDRTPSLVAAAQAHIDTSPPVVAVADPAASAAFTFCFGGTPVEVGLTAQEMESAIADVGVTVGADPVSLSKYGLGTTQASAAGMYLAGPVGEYAIDASATSAGGMGHATARFVVGYGVTWLPPFASGKVAEGGATIPVKFTISDCSGRFVRDDSVHVTVHEITGGGEVEQFSAALGTGAASVRIDEVRGQYLVNFQTAPGPHDYRVEVIFNGASQASKAFSVR